jgi:hypothetical protein
MVTKPWYVKKPFSLFSYIKIIGRSFPTFLCRPSPLPGFVHLPSVWIGKEIVRSDQDSNSSTKKEVNPMIKNPALLAIHQSIESCVRFGDSRDR